MLSHFVLYRLPDGFECDPVHALPCSFRGTLQFGAQGNGLFWKN
jgi:hypothetical protein